MRTVSGFAFSILLIGLTNGTNVSAQTRPESIDAAVVSKIKEEGQQRSQVMEIASYLTDVHGPRLTGSPATRVAGEWAQAKLSEWGLQNAHLEPWGPFGRGWSLDKFSANLVEPGYTPLIAMPKAWSPGTTKVVRGEPIFIDASSEADLAKYRGRLLRSIVFVGAPRTVKALFDAPARRHTDESLLNLANADFSGARGGRGGPPRTSSGDRPATPPADGPRPNPNAAQPAPADGQAVRPGGDQRSTMQLQNEIWQMIYDEGVAVAVEAAPGDGGTVFVSSARLPRQREPEGGERANEPGNNALNRGPRPWAVDSPEIVPQVVMAVEHYNRIIRMLQRGSHPQLEIDIASRYHSDDLSSFNVIAEIPGTDLKDEVVMLGAHFDSWHSGTGATDNAIGCSVALEAVRILQALSVKPRRTIRVALWTGEEQGLLGSRAYVAEHFGRAIPAERSNRLASESRGESVSGSSGAAGANENAGSPSEPKAAATEQPAAQANGQPGDQPSRARPRTKYELKSEHQHLAAYFNLDNGAGKIRGIYLQGNESLRPVFRAWLKPFADMGASTISLAATGGTDHQSFDGVGLPGFQFIQDPLEYSSRTHHSNMDVFDRLQTDDAKQASIIMATFVYQAAMRDEKLQRKPLDGEIVSPTEPSAAATTSTAPANP